MKKTILIICIILFTFELIYSQTSNFANVLDTRTYSFSYFGNNLLKPGIKIDANVILKEKTINKSKTKKNGEIIDKSKTKQLLIGGDIGFFWHPKSHIGVFNYYTFSSRKIKLKNNKFTTLGFGLGIYRSFYPKTYEVDDAGNVNEISLAGRTYFAPVLTFGTGRLIEDRTLQSINFNTNLMFLFNYNSGIVPLLNFELGFCFDLKLRNLEV